MKACTKTNRQAITLIELLIAIGIVGLLVSLTLPAILRARDASRRLSCASRLQQLAVAAQGHVSQTGVFPHGKYRISHLFTNFSPHAQLLPYLEQAQLFNGINFECEASDRSVFAASIGAACNRTVAEKKVSCFLCPSEVQVHARVNYRGNTAPHPFAGTARSYVQRTGAAFGPFTPLVEAISPAGIADGLAQTALFSERVAGDFHEALFDPFRDVADSDAPTMDLEDVDAYTAHCRDFGDPGPSHRSDLGTWWLYSRVDTLYNHTLTPNSSIPDCGHIFDPPLIAAVSARSYHFGGVNVAFADGHVRFLSQQIDLGVWRALGGRNDGGAVSDF
jgi:prepilin-type processing-associated H-X9-DG protein